MNSPSPFDTICRLAEAETGIPSPAGAEEELFFILEPDSSDRCFIRLTDARGRERLPHGREDDPARRSVNRQILDIQAGRTGNFSWTGEKDGLYLDEYPGLLQDIREAGISLYWRNPQSPLRDTGAGAQPVLQLAPRREGFTLKLTLRSAGEEKPFGRALSRDLVLSSDELYNTASLGSHYNRLGDLTGWIGRDELDRTLSLFSSLFSHVAIRMEGYEWAETGPAEAEHALCFDSLTEEGALKVTARWYLEGYPLDFITTYRPVSLIRADHEKKRFTRRELRYPEKEDSLKGFVHTLKKLEKQEGLSSGYAVEDEAFYLSAELALPFLSAHIGEIASRYRLFGTEALQKLKLKKVNPRFSFQTGSGIDYFEGTGTLELGEESFPLEEALKLYDENLYIPLSDGSKAILDTGYIKALRRLVGKYRKKEGNYRVSLFDLPLLEQLIDAKITGAGMDRSRELFEGFNRIEESPLPPGCRGLKGTLRDYQVYGVKWLAYLQKHKLGGCLADDMGLGKTIQTIALLADYYNGSTKKKVKHPSLIVLPRSLLYNWKTELKRFAPDLTVHTYYGAQRDLEEAEKSRIILTTYALVRNDIEALQLRDFAYIVLDEAQAIRNSSSRISRAVMLLKGEHRLALSGTPVENRLSEVYSLFRFLNPALLGTESAFNREFASPIQKNGDETALRILSGRIAPFTLRRLKQQVAAELPEKSEQTLFVEMEGEQLRLYEERRRFYEKVIKEKIAVEGVEKSRFLILQGLLELRQLASVPESKTDGEVASAKWDALLDHLGEVTAEGHRCLIFTNFLGSVEIMERKLEEAGIPWLTMTGATRNRAELVEAFQDSREYKVFLMTLKTGGVGLNLTGADYVYILDPWWNRGAEQQAIDRTHRIGQKNNVFCYRLISRGTIEEKMLELQAKKTELVSALISSDSGAVKALSGEDIDYLLQREV